MTSRSRHIEFPQGGISQTAGTYGSIGTYGQQAVTYGQPQGEAALTGIRYVLLPTPGWGPSAATWVFRKGDTAQPFSAIITNHKEPADRLDLSAVSAARLVLRRTNIGKTYSNRNFDLTVNTGNDTITRTWAETDLQEIGTFLVAIQLKFDTGRKITVQSDDTVTLQVYDR